MSYDQTQKKAVLTQCVVCGLWSFQTHPKDVCSVCERERERDRQKKEQG